MRGRRSLASSITIFPKGSLSKEMSRKTFFSLETGGEEEGEDEEEGEVGGLLQSNGVGGRYLTKPSGPSSL